MQTNPLKVQYASRLKGKDSNAITSQKKGDVASHSIVVDCSNPDCNSFNSEKSQNDMKRDHVENMADLSKKADRNLLSCTVVASNGNGEGNVGIDEGISEKEAGACPRHQTLFDKAKKYFVKQQAKFPNDKIPF